jgi:hypothetical protein
MGSLSQTAVIKESLRISALVTARAVLQAPGECLTYRDWVIPENVGSLSLSLSGPWQITNGNKTPVGMTLSDLMMDPRIFPDPDTFDPERWLETSPDYARNSKYFFPFHRGHRNCIGMK